ncbi:dual specificity protein phosphatase [Trypanosoma rangeli]|uniref:protein-tyrosine-phosphatase n=1 Tax=Trypanosoma rangeli TaxID=5698 RepID=A0A3R7MN76_TRYRA|nr:dual specificity protein phosphatase [Trypanosoma rangeli]RNF05566.1 dual specificity protein phosphatase [Trypanosoma rangeli]|eukprot:RNF05566.1 dual specificity protein phosphatase [Trypanosoma rangeli]
MMGSGKEGAEPSEERQRQPPLQEPEGAQHLGVKKGGSREEGVDEVEDTCPPAPSANADVPNCMTDVREEQHAAAATVTVESRWATGTSRGGSGGGVPATAGSFVVGSTSHVSLTGTPTSSIHARMSSFGRSSTHMKAVINVICRRTCGERKQTVPWSPATGVPPHLPTPRMTATAGATAKASATPNETAMLTPALSHSEHGRSATSSMNETPFPAAPLGIGLSTPPSHSSSNLSEPHSCYEKEEERNYFRYNFAPRLQTRFSLNQMPSGTEATSGTQKEGHHQEEQQQEEDDAATEQQHQQFEEVLFADNKDVSGVHHRWPEVSAKLQICVPASPLWPAPGEAIPTCKHYSSDVEFSTSSSFGSGYSRSVLQAYNQPPFVRSGGSLFTDTPCVSPCMLAFDGGDAEALPVMAKIPNTVTKTPAATTMKMGPTDNDGGGSSGRRRVLPSHYQKKFYLRCDPTVPSGVSQEGSIGTIPFNNVCQNVVAALCPPTSQGVDSTTLFDAAMVLPGLYLGSYSDALKLPALAAHGISLVLNVAEECVIDDVVADNDYNIKFICFPLKDHSDENIARYFGPLTRIIHRQLHRRERALWSARKTAAEANEHDDAKVVADASSNACVPGGVLVHCRMGVSRSAAVVLAYLMFYGDTLVVSEGCYSQQRMEESPTLVGTPSMAATPLFPLAGNDDTAVKGSRGTCGRCCECCCCLAHQNHRDDHGGDCGAARRVVKSYREAFAFLKKRKRDINPNIGFVLALRELDGDEGK